MKDSRRFTAVLILMSMTLSAPLFAAEGTAGDYVTGMGKNLGRGVWNMLSSPAEIPCTMADDISEKGGATGSFTGFGKGLAFMVRRIVVGASEVLTFVLPAEPVIPGVCREA